MGFSAPLDIGREVLTHPAVTWPVLGHDVEVVLTAQLPRLAPLAGHLGEQDHPHDLPHPYVGKERLASWGDGQLPAPARELL